MLNLYAATRNETLRVDLKTQIGDFAVENDFVTRFTSLVVVAAQTRKRRSKEKQRQIRELFDQFAKDETMSLDQEWFYILVTTVRSCFSRAGFDSRTKLLFWFVY